MKQFIVFTIGLLAGGSLFAQKTTTTPKTMTPAEKAAADMHKNAVGGFIRDARNHPLEGVQAFIYPGDSANSIIASGYSDATGYYETNSVLPGKYNIKIVYPTTNKAIMVPNVIMKKGITNISLKNDPLATDTTIQYAFFQPKPVEKVKPKKK